MLAKMQHQAAAAAMQSAAMQCAAVNWLLRHQWYALSHSVSGAERSARDIADLSPHACAHSIIHVAASHLMPLLM